MPVAWNPENDARLLMAYIEVADAKLGNEEWKAIADKLGGGATVSGISQRFKKVLKKKYGGDNVVISSGDGGSAATTPVKGRGRKKDTGIDPNKTPRELTRKRGSTSKDDDDVDDDEVTQDSSPGKKMKEKELKSFFDEE